MVSNGEGEIEKEGKILVVKRIHVTYHLKLSADNGDLAEQRELAERTHGFHAEYCPVARTIRDCVDITTSLEFEEE